MLKSPVLPVRVTVRAAEIDPRQRQSEAAGEGQHGLHIGRIGAVACLVFFARQALSASDEIGQRLRIRAGLTADAARLLPA